MATIIPPEDLARYIDHTLLRSTATAADFKQLCAEAAQHGFFSVCVPTSWVSFASKELKGSSAKVCTVVGFPQGYTLSETKAFETSRALELGAHEIDVVANLSLFKSGSLKACEDDLRQVVMAASGKTVKVILETCYLSDPEIVDLSKIAQQAGAQFVKTSTGFGTGGATIKHVALMRETVGPSMGVKASGGIKNFTAAMQMISAGANRLGTSSGVTIVREALGQMDSNGAPPDKAY